MYYRRAAVTAFVLLLCVAVSRPLTALPGEEQELDCSYVAECIASYHAAPQHKLQVGVRVEPPRTTPLGVQAVKREHTLSHIAYLPRDYSRSVLLQMHPA